MAGNWSSSLKPDRVMEARRKLEAVAGTRPAFAAFAVSETVALAEIEPDSNTTDVHVDGSPGASILASPERSGGNKAGRIKARLHDLGLVHFIRRDIG